MIAVVLSGGGERVVAWQVGILAGLADGALDLRRATIAIGTSAGALVAARLAAGIDPRADARAITPRPSLGGAAAFDALADAWRAAGATTTQRRRAFGQVALERSPGGEDAFVATVERRLPDPAWPPALRVVAIDAQSGERVVFDRDAGVAPARAIAASRAIPALFPPVTVGGRPFIDGALGSATNADALAGADATLVFVITAVPAVPAERVEHGPERFWQEALADELAVLESAGHRVVVVHAAGRGARGDGRRSDERRDRRRRGGRRPAARALRRPSDQPAPGRVGRRRGARRLAELRADVGDVAVHGVRADDQPRGDVGVAEPLGDQSQDLRLGAQRSASIAARPVRRGRARRRRRLRRIVHVEEPATAVTIAALSPSHGGCSVAVRGHELRVRQQRGDLAALANGIARSSRRWITSAGARTRARTSRMSVAYTVSSIAAATSGVAAARWRRANRSRISASAPGSQTSASSREPAPQCARTVSSHRRPQRRRRDLRRRPRSCRRAPGSARARDARPRTPTAEHAPQEIPSSESSATPIASATAAIVRTSASSEIARRVGRSDMPVPTRS